VGGLVQIPGVTHVVESFLDPTFQDSRFIDIEVSTTLEVLALLVGAACSISGIGLAYWMYVRAPGTSLRLAERFRGVHDFLAHKWYFDELYDTIFVRPTRAFGAWSANVFERVVVGGLVSGTAYAVRAGNSIVRVAQTGVVRNYALLLMTGVTALALYFLVVSR